MNNTLNKTYHIKSAIPHNLKTLITMRNSDGNGLTEPHHAAILIHVQDGCVDRGWFSSNTEADLLMLVRTNLVNRGLTDVEFVEREPITLPDIYPLAD